MTVGRQTPFGNLVRRHRLAAGLTQEELAERAQVSVRAVSDIERGVNRRPYKSTVGQLAGALGLSEDDRTEFIGASRGGIAEGPTLSPAAAGDESVATGILAGGAGLELAAPRPTRYGRLLWGAGAVLLLVALSAGGIWAWSAFHPTGATSLRPGQGARDSTLRQRERSALTAAVLRSDRAYRASRACACDAGLASAKVDPDLQTYRRIIADLRSRGERMITSFHSFRVTSIRIESPTSGEVVASKDETAEIRRGGRTISVCSGPYQVRYHIVSIGAGWRVDDTQLIGGQACHSL